MFKPKWRDMKSAPRDGTEVILYDRTHGIIQGWFRKGEWEEHYEYGREYTGSSWVLGDDLTQVEVEELPREAGYGYHDGTVLGWMPKNKLQQTKLLELVGKAPYECFKHGCVTFGFFGSRTRNLQKTFKCKKCDRNKLKNEIDTEKHPIHGTEDEFCKWLYGKTVEEMRSE